jgi:predicted GTPase
VSLSPQQLRDMLTEVAGMIKGFIDSNPRIREDSAECAHLNTKLDHFCQKYTPIMARGEWTLEELSEATIDILSVITQIPSFDTSEVHQYCAELLDRIEKQVCFIF